MDIVIMTVEGAISGTPAPLPQAEIIFHSNSAIFPQCQITGAIWVRIIMETIFRLSVCKIYKIWALRKTLFTWKRKFTRGWRNRDRTTRDNSKTRFNNSNNRSNNNSNKIYKVSLTFICSRLKTFTRDIRVKLLLCMVLFHKKNP